jgi:O-antigen polysaccharide polymerase Wzy
MSRVIETSQTGSDATLIPLRRWHRVVILALFGVVLFGAARGVLNTNYRSSGLVLTLLFVFVALRVAPLFVPGPHRAWFHPLVFGALLTLVDLVRRFDVFANGLSLHTGIQSGTKDLNALVAYDLFLSSLALGAYYLGFAIATKAVRNRRPRVPRWTRNSERIVPRLAVISWLGVAVALLFVESAGGVTTRLAEVLQTRHENLQGQYYFALVALVLVPALWLWLAYRPTAVRNALFVIPALVAIPVVFVVTGSRGGLIYTMLITLIILAIQRRHVSATAIAVFAIVGVFLVSALGDVRQSFQETNEVSFGAARQNSFLDVIETGITGEIRKRATESDGALPIYAYVPDQTDFLYGRSYLAVATIPVPRSLWPQKPGLIDGVVSKAFFGGTGGVPAGGVAEAYWNFWLPGVVVVFALFGAFQAALVRWFTAQRGAPAATVIYAVLLVLLANPSSTAVVNCLRSLALVVLVILAVGALSFRVPRRTTAGSSAITPRRSPAGTSGEDRRRSG